MVVNGEMLRSPERFVTAYAPLAVRTSAGAVKCTSQNLSSTRSHRLNVSDTRRNLNGHFQLSVRAFLGNLTPNSPKWRDPPANDPEEDNGTY
jgi:hypothetical protein